MSLPDSWAWTFYDTDGVSVLATTTVQNPSHTYAASGVYPTKLVASLTGVGSSAPLTQNVTVRPIPVFSHISTTMSPLTIGSNLTGATPTITLPAIAVGDVVLLHIQWSDQTDSSVTDSLGNTYTKRGTTYSRPTNGTAFVSTYSAVATSGGSSPDVTAHLAGSATYVALIGQVFRPLAGTAAFVGVAQASGAGANPMDSGALDSGGTAALGLFGYWSFDAADPVVPTDYTARVAGRNFVADNLVAVDAGTYHFIPTFTGTQQWFAQLIAFTSGGGSDTTPPSIAITAPVPPTATVTLTPTTLVGTASDDVGVTSVTWANSATGGAGTATGTSPTWSVSIPCIVGTNVITMSAHDAAGHTTDAVITLTLTSPLIQPPRTVAPPVTVAPPRTSP